MPGWGCPLWLRKVKCWSHTGSVYTYIIWMICTIGYLRADFDWIIPSRVLHVMSYVWNSPVSFRRRALLGSLTDDSATTAPKLNNYKKVQWTSFLLDEVLELLAGGKKLKIKCFQKNFYLLWFCLSLCFVWVRCPSGVAWVPCKWGPLPMRCSFLWLPFCLLFRSWHWAHNRDYRANALKMFMFYICMVLFLYPLSLPNRSWLLRVQVKNRIHPDFNMLAMTPVLLSSLNQGSV